MEIRDYPSYQPTPLTDEDRQLVDDCYKSILAMMNKHNATLILPHALTGAPSAPKHQTGTKNA